MVDFIIRCTYDFDGKRYVQPTHQFPSSLKKYKDHTLLYIYFIIMPSCTSAEVYSLSLSISIYIFLLSFSCLSLPSFSWIVITSIFFLPFDFNQTTRRAIHYKPKYGIEHFTRGVPRVVLLFQG